MVDQRIRNQRLLVLTSLAVGMAAALLSSTALLSAQERDADFRPQRVVDRYPPITDFPVKTVRESQDAINPSELVIGVTVGKESRAYPVNMLTGPQREILNDTLGGKVIAATW